MKHILYIALMIAASTVAFAANSPDDASAIQGNWTPVKGEFRGRPVADDVLKSISLRLDNGKYEAVAGGHPDRGVYTVDSASAPKRLTITGTEGPNAGKTFPAIYELNDDTLRICYDLSGAKHPAEFKSIEGTQFYLVTYHRQKKETTLPK